MRKSLLSIIAPFCVHSTLSNSLAQLLLCYLEDRQLQLRWIFSAKLPLLMECECSTLEGRDQVRWFIVLIYGGPGVLVLKPP